MVVGIERHGRLRGRRVGGGGGSKAMQGRYSQVDLIRADKSSIYIQTEGYWM